MNNIRVENFGPIRKVDIDLNKVNVFIGPQSSGKSTIAKIISYCQWVEKRYILEGKFKYNFSDKFIEFHRIDESYFNSNSLIEYRTKHISISYKGLDREGNIQVEKESSGFKISKNIYIPSERNFVSVIPNLNKYNETNDNIMSFVYDWYDAKRVYSKKNPLEILNLGISYHHNSETDQDILKLLKNKKEISLMNASSGLQSIIPLIMLVDYLTVDIFKKTIPLSVNEKLQLYRNDRNSFLDFIKKELADIKESQSKIADTRIGDLKDEPSKFKEMSKRLNDLDILIREFDLNKIDQKDYALSKIIIEEPEQNLFPETQRDLIYHLLERIVNTDRDHFLTITTHSPYILYALNNCMLGYVIKNNIDKNEELKLKSQESWIDPNLVSIWEINEGELISIKNKKTNTVSDHYFNDIMNKIMDEYYVMLNYLDL